MGFSFRECIDVPDADLSDFQVGTRKVCLNIPDNAISDSTRNCGYANPQVASVDVNLFSEDLDGNVDVDLSMWFGFEMRSSGLCLWIGQEEAGVCVTDCGFDIAASYAADAFTDLANDFVNALEQAAGIDVPNWWWAVGGILATVIALALAFFFGPEVALGAAVGAA